MLTAAESPPAPPFRAAVQGGDYLFLSGQIGVVPKDADPHAAGLDAAAAMAMDQLGKALHGHQADFGDVVRCTVMLADMRDWARFNQTYVRYFKPDRLPARSAFGGVQLAYGAALEVECIAYVPRGRSGG